MCFSSTKLLQIIHRVSLYLSMTNEYVKFIKGKFWITNVFHLVSFWIISIELRFIFHLIMMKHSQCVVFTFLSIIMKQKRILIKFFQSCFYSLKDNLRCLDKYKMSSFNYLSSLSLSLSLCFLCLAYILSANS